MEQIRKYPASYYELKYILQERTPKGSTKPDAEVLESIVADLNLSKADCIYVGDGPYKDVRMAQDAGIDDFLAEYGKAQDRAEYQLLRDVTHWTNDDVEREKRIRARDVDARYRLVNSFSELLGIFEFGDFDERKCARA